MLPGLFMPLACGLHIFAKEKRPEGRWHPFGSEAEDDGHNRVKHIRVQHGDQLLSVILFSCILYAASGEILQNSSRQHGEIYAAGTVCVCLAYRGVLHGPRETVCVRISIAEVCIKRKKLR